MYLLILLHIQLNIKSIFVKISAFSLNSRRKEYILPIAIAIGAMAH